jgi:hypothetical protein
MSLCLPLPPGWKKLRSKQSAGGKEDNQDGNQDGDQEGEKEMEGGNYVHEESGLVWQCRPSDAYIYKLLHWLRAKKVLSPNSLPALRTMAFWDEVLRRYECDLRGVVFVPKESAGPKLGEEDFALYDRVLNERRAREQSAHKNLPSQC